jgi:hypothetical protein
LTNAFSALGLKTGFIAIEVILFVDDVADFYYLSQRSNC